MSFVTSNMMYFPNGQLNVEYYRQFMIPQGASASERKLKYVLAKDNDSSIPTSLAAAAASCPSSTAMVPSTAKRVKRQNINNKGDELVLYSQATATVTATATATATATVKATAAAGAAAAAAYFGSYPSSSQQQPTPVDPSPARKGKRNIDDRGDDGLFSSSSATSATTTAPVSTLSFASATMFGPSPAKKGKRNVSVVRSSSSSSSSQLRQAIPFSSATTFGPSVSAMKGKRKIDDRDNDGSFASSPAKVATTPAPATFFNKKEQQTTPLFSLSPAKTGKRTIETSVAVSDGDDDDADDTQDRKPSVCILCSDDDDDDSVVEVVIPSPTTKTAPTASAATVSSSDDDNDDEVEIVGSTGNNANSDYAHARCDCTVHQFNNTNNGSIFLASPSTTKKNEQCCKLCYCFVCDIPASECKEWCGAAGHCNATSTNHEWGRLRRKKRGAKKAKATRAANKKAAATATTKTRVKAKNNRPRGNKKKKAPPVSVSVPSTTVHQCSGCATRMQEKDVALTIHSTIRFCYDCIIRSKSNNTAGTNAPIHPGTKICSSCGQQGHCRRTSQDCPTYWKNKKAQMMRL